MSAPEDPLLERLHQLPLVPFDGSLDGPVPGSLDDLSAERVRRRAQAVLAAEKRLAARPWLIPVERVWSRALYPALVTSAVGSYLFWAFRTAADLYR